MALTGEYLLSDPAIGFIADIALSGGRIWLVDYKGPPFFHIVDTTTRQILFSRGRKGTGPGDFHFLEQIIPVGGASRDMWGFDAGAHRLVRLTEDGRPRPDQSVTLDRAMPLMSIVRIGRGWVAWSRSQDSTKRYVGFDEKGAVAFTAPGPLLGDASISFRQRANASGTRLTLCVRPARDRFALVCGYAGRIELRGANAELLALARVPDSSNGDFITTRSGNRVWRDTKYYYPHCAATDTYLFALYSGKRTRDPKTGEPLRDYGVTDHVHVFDWTGRFVRSLALDRGLTALTISPDGRWLYGTDADSSALFRFPLPAFEP